MTTYEPQNRASLRPLHPGGPVRRLLRFKHHRLCYPEPPPRLHRQNGMVGPHFPPAMARDTQARKGMQPYLEVRCCALKHTLQWAAPVLLDLLQRG